MMGETRWSTKLSPNPSTGLSLVNQRFYLNQRLEHFVFSKNTSSEGNKKLTIYKFEDKVWQTYEGIDISQKTLCTDDMMNISVFL